jgi:plasmid stabilization system protein ParE
MLPLRWTERAVGNLADIADFISRTSAVYAEGVVLRIDQQLALLRQYPQLGKTATEAEDLGVRELVIDSYRVFYRPRSDCVEVLAIAHGRQLAPREFE